MGRVIGNVVSTMKHDCYKNKKLALVKPISPNNELIAGVHVAVDLVGAGKGDTVILSSEGRAAEELCGFTTRMPLRTLIVGIVDSVESDAK